MASSIAFQTRIAPATSSSRAQNSGMKACSRVCVPPPSASSSSSSLRARVSGRRAAPQGRRSLLLVTRAESEAKTTSAPVDTGSFEPMLKMEELPKGSREIRETSNGKSVLFFWYRNEICAIESRSPAEGAYSFGFLTSRLTQEGGVECPGTGTIFSLKDGSIMDWYPDNPFLRALTPQDTCRPMEVFTVKVENEAIMVDPVNTNISESFDTSATTQGGANTSLENNNVFGLEPQMYLENGEEISDSSGAVGKVDPATLVISILAVGLTAVAGTAACLFYENIIALGVFWAVGFGATAYTVYKFQEDEN